MEKVGTKFRGMRKDDASVTGGCKEREALAIHKSLKINECCGNDRYFEEN
ncbi:MAG: hypothetical protein IJE78_01065 [Bacteroidaceae bacterium]|nr:hypothetical protein [Bacteroidaceae bacterium]